MKMRKVFSLPKNEPLYRRSVGGILQSQRQVKLNPKLHPFNPMPRPLNPWALPL